jgi:aspartyl-tRNA(Asn)/glutamyl-tRNA(Gln) amidotransferase subunit C
MRRQTLESSGPGREAEPRKRARKRQPLDRPQHSQDHEALTCRYAREKAGERGRSVNFARSRARKGTSVARHERVGDRRQRSTIPRAKSTSAVRVHGASLSTRAAGNHRPQRDHYVLGRDSNQRIRTCHEQPARHRQVIGREQVLHVAKLARLRLSDEEIDRMSSELSGILDHIEKINELDLDDVAPTSHVVTLENVLRPDEPRPSWPRERVLEAAPDAGDGGFRVPSPGG